jgi:RsmE family RNA methyltransferase
VRLDDWRAEHVRGVLKLGVGGTLRVGVIDGALGTATVCGIDEGTVRLACALDGDTPPRPRIDLLLALPRPKVLRRLWAQLAAIGVGRIILTNAARVEGDYFGTHWLEPSAYRRLLIEGLQQARDTRLPDVSVHRRFRVLIEDELDALAGPPDTGALRLAAHPGDAPSIREAVAAGIASASARRQDVRALLAVGPEGGWNPFELALLTGHGFHLVSLGARPLRTDTACVSLMAAVNQELR